MSILYIYISNVKLQHLHIYFFNFELFFVFFNYVIQITANINEYFLLYISSMIYTKYIVESIH